MTTSRDSKKQKLSKLRSKIKEALKANDEKSLELRMSDFADLATSEQLFQICLSFHSKYKALATHFIGRSASPNALVWLKKRSLDPLVREVMEVWLISQWRDYEEQQF